MIIFNENIYSYNYNNNNMYKTEGSIKLSNRKTTLRLKLLFLMVH